MPDLVSLNQIEDACPLTSGGITHSYYIDCSDLDDVTVDGNNQVTALTIDVAADFVKFVFDDDDTAYYNQEGERNGNKLQFNQTAFMKFSGIDYNKVNNANRAGDLCCTVWIHRSESDVAMIQGIQYNENNSTWSFTRQRAKITPSIFTDTGDNVERLEWTVTSVGQYASPITTYTDAQIEAL